jgi:hypothetical protein
MADAIKAYKGFDENFCCRGMQFKVGESYHHNGKVVPCESGFHACVFAADVWKYYGPCSRFAEVELFGETHTHNEDSKVSASDIRIVRELSLSEFTAIIASTSSVPPEVSPNNTEHGAKIGSSGDGAQIGSSGYGAKIGSSGNDAQIGSSGNDAQIGSSGDYAQIGSSGTDAKIGSSGNGAKIGSSGDYAKIGSSGTDAQIGSSGDDAQIGSSGTGAKIEVNGDNSVVACANKSEVKGIIGSWFSVAEFVDGKCVGFATGCIGKDGLLPDVWYVAKGGKLVPK